MQQSLDTTSSGIMLAAMIIRAQEKVFKLKNCRSATIGIVMRSTINVN